MQAGVFTLPTSRGERIVVAMLEGQAVARGIDDLGFPLDAVEELKRAARAPSGLVLVVGPRRSGKTTTLYAVLEFVNTASACILTAEDPIVRPLDGIHQTQVQAGLGFSYAAALRAFARQDPDLIMVQQIRDAETADAVLQTAVDGCAVLSSVDATDGPGALLALTQLGASPAIVGSAVRLVLAQRLVRTICARCKTEYAPSKDQLAALSVVRASGAGPGTLFRGTGCSECGHTGYRGRAAVCETLTPSDGLRRALLEGASAEELRRRAVDSGLTTLSRNTLAMVLDGTTTWEEHWRVVAAVS